MRYRQDDHIPPKKPYSFEAMLNDILEFAAVSLVDEGRLSLWMPTANDEEVEFGIPSHPCLEVVSICVQAFNKCKSYAASTTTILSQIDRVSEAPYISKKEGRRDRRLGPYEIQGARQRSNSR